MDRLGETYGSNQMGITILARTEGGVGGVFLQDQEFFSTEFGGKSAFHYWLNN